MFETGNIQLWPTLEFFVAKPSGGLSQSIVTESVVTIQTETGIDIFTE